MRVRNLIALGCFSVMSLTACTSSGQTVWVVNQTVTPNSTSYITANVSDSGRGMAFIRINKPSDKSVQALSHRWLATDVFEYRLILEAANADGDYVALDPAISLTVPNKVDYPAAATFTGLKAGEKYRLRLEAWGNDGGTAAGSHMNAKSETTAIMDLTGDTIETLFNLNMQVKLDPQIYTGSADVNIDPPADASPAEEPETEATGATFLGHGTDLMRPEGYTTDGINDGHFKLVMDVPADTTVTKIGVTGGPFGGAWSSDGHLVALAGVFQDGEPVNTDLSAPLGTYSGRVVFDVYLPSDPLEGWYAPGSAFHFSVFDQNGNHTNYTATVE